MRKSGNDHCKTAVKFDGAMSCTAESGPKRLMLGLDSKKLNHKTGEGEWRGGGGLEGLKGVEYNEISELW